MTDWRWAVAGALLAAAVLFVGAARVAFRRPAGPHRWAASRVSGAIAVLEIAATAAAPVPTARAAAAGALLAAAVALFLWTAWTCRGRQLGLAFAGELPARLQTRGPYRLVRHPFYASYLLAFAAGAVGAWTLFVLPAVAAGVFTYASAARAEEAAILASGLGGEYRAYARRVGRFVPRPPLPSTRPSAPASSRSPEGNAG